MPEDQAMATSLPSDQAYPAHHSQSLQPMAATDEPSHSVLVGYIFWVLGFLGAHRFFFGKPLTGILWFFTGGLLLVGWIVDLFLIPKMAEEADVRFPNGSTDYNLAWLLLMFLGIFGIHRFYMGKYITGAIYLLTGGIFGVGYVYDILTLNDQIAEQN